jgi:1-deoxy-D-xylulose 5-phosphate reductoisomerase
LNISDVQNREHQHSKIHNWRYAKPKIISFTNMESLTNILQLWYSAKVKIPRSTIFNAANEEIDCSEFLQQQLLYLQKNQTAQTITPKTEFKYSMKSSYKVLQNTP